VHDLDEAANLVRSDDEVVYADAGYQGADKRPEFADDVHLSRMRWRVAARKGRLKTMAAPDRAEQSRQASVRAKVEHPFLIVKRDFGFTKTRYRGLDKNLNHLHMLFASSNWLSGHVPSPSRADGQAPACPQPVRKAPKPTADRLSSHQRAHRPAHSHPHAQMSR
jgi:hypothetical protein